MYHFLVCDIYFLFVSNFSQENCKSKGRIWFKRREKYKYLGRIAPHRVGFHTHVHAHVYVSNLRNLPVVSISTTAKATCTCTSGRHHPVRVLAVLTGRRTRDVQHLGRTECDGLLERRGRGLRAERPLHGAQHGLLLVLLPVQQAQQVLDRALRSPTAAQVPRAPGQGVLRAVRQSPEGRRRGAEGSRVNGARAAKGLRGLPPDGSRRSMFFFAN